MNITKKDVLQHLADDLQALKEIDLDRITGYSIVITSTEEGLPVLLTLSSSVNFLELAGALHAMCTKLTQESTRIHEDIDEATGANAAQLAELKEFKKSGNKLN